MVNSTNYKEDFDIKQENFQGINFVSFSSDYFCATPVSKVFSYSRVPLLNTLIIFLFHITFYMLLLSAELLLDFTSYFSYLVILCRENRFREGMR